MDPVKPMFGTQVRTLSLHCTSALTQCLWMVHVLSLEDPWAQETHLFTWLDVLRGCWR